jgi:hypothetical protein
VSVGVHCNWCSEFYGLGIYWSDDDPPSCSRKVLLQVSRLCPSNVSLAHVSLSV